MSSDKPLGEKQLSYVVAKLELCIFETKCKNGCVRFVFYFLKAWYKFNIAYLSVCRKYTYTFCAIYEQMHLLNCW